MATLLMVVAGCLVGGGVFLTVAATTGYLQLPEKDRSLIDLRTNRGSLRRLALALGGGTAAWLMTGWPAVAVAVGLLGWWSVEILTDRRARHHADVTEAISVWAAMLADTISASAGIERAVLASVDHGPVLLRPELRRMEQRLRLSQVGVIDALTEFAARLENPTADLVAVTVRVAADQGSSKMPEQLWALAKAADAESKMLNRVAAARKGMFVFKRVVFALVLLVGVAMPMAAPALTKAYQSVTGQIFLSFVCLLFAVALWWMERLTSHRQSRYFGPGATQ